MGNTRLTFQSALGLGLNDVEELKAALREVVQVHDAILGKSIWSALHHQFLMTRLEKQRWFAVFGSFAMAKIFLD